MNLIYVLSDLGELAQNIDNMWMLIGAALVFFMQAGFAMVETGFTRAKNAGNIIMKNLLDFACGTVVYWFLGFGIMMSEGNGFIGTPELFTSNGGDYITMIFQTVFCATAATIVSGAMAERTKFSSYIIYSCLISLIIYPISGHWIWGGGWLAEMGFHDFAGSTAVHFVGGAAALVGAKILGPRIGKYTKDGKSHAFPGHSLTLGALGVFILWFCWFGFNGASTLSMTDGNDQLAGLVFYNTSMAACTATLAALAVTWIKYKKPDVSMTLNGSLAGLVAITAGCDQVDPWAAAVIGLIAGVVVVFAIEFVDKVLKIDDPVGAVGVHGVCGMLGTILLGFFSTSDGLFYGFGGRFLGVQILGVVAVGAWVISTMTIIFLAIKHTVGLRVSAEEEIRGLDICEHGLISAYADFAPTVYGNALEDYVGSDVSITGDIPASKAVEIVDNTTEKLSKVAKDANGMKFTKIEIICRQNMFDPLKKELSSIGVTGMTVINVLGCGMQKGKTEYYRGTPVEVTLLPKVQVDLVVAKVPVKQVVETAKKVLYTGHIGDGKIFVYDVENVIKIRTGEEGYDALQDTEE